MISTSMIGAAVPPGRLIGVRGLAPCWYSLRHQDHLPEGHPALECSDAVARALRRLALVCSRRIDSMLFVCCNWDEALAEWQIVRHGDTRDLEDLLEAGFPDARLPDELRTAGGRRLRAGWLIAGARLSEFTLADTFEPDPPKANQTRIRRCAWAEALVTGKLPDPLPGRSAGSPTPDGLWSAGTIPGPG